MKGGCHHQSLLHQCRRAVSQGQDLHARAGFDDAFLYDELRKDQSVRTLPATQLLGDEAWSSFAAWIASENKIKY